MESYPIFILQKELETIKKRIDSDVIVDFRFKDEIDEDKDKVRQLKRSIEVLKNEKEKVTAEMYENLDSEDFKNVCNLKK